VIFAHVGGVPLEELLPSVGGAAGLLFARAWLALRMRRGRESEPLERLGPNQGRPV
jgi:hypothetical protein